MEITWDPVGTNRELMDNKQIRLSDTEEAEYTVEERGKLLCSAANSVVSQETK